MKYAVVLSNGNPHIVEKPAAIYPVWLNETEKDQIIANWEKTGLFGSIVSKVRAAESAKGTK